MYELMVLSLLMPHPLNGYSIAKVINNIVGPFAKVSNGRLYPLLAQLEQTGLVTVVGEPAGPAEGGRPTRTFAITDAGRARFHDLMLDTASNPGDYAKLFLYKVRALYMLAPAERLHLIDHYLNFCQAHRLHLAAKIADLTRRGALLPPAELAASLAMMRHVLDGWERELVWARELRTQAGAETPHEGDQAP